MIYDIIVIGAGQAGLSMGYYLKGSGLSFLIVDNQERIGDVWRKRYDSLVLFTPRSYSSLHGLALEGDSEGLPTKDELGDYLERYAQTFNLPIQLQTKVQLITKQQDVFIIQTEQSILKAKHIVVATGPFHTPSIPSFANEFSKDVVQLHSSQYKNPTQLQEGTVLIVGGGNSGAQIAAELSALHPTYLSVSQPLRFLPIAIANKSIFWWFDKFGLLKVSSSSFIGRKLQAQGDPIFGFELNKQLNEQKVTIKGRTIQAHNQTVTFMDQSSLEIRNIIWATGFTLDYSWLDFPSLLDSNGKVNHQRGITPIAGLYFLGLPWQHRRGSALLMGVGDDARYLYQRIMNKNK